MHYVKIIIMYLLHKYFTIGRHVTPETHRHRGSVMFTSRMSSPPFSPQEVPENSSFTKA